MRKWLTHLILIKKKKNDDDKEDGHPFIISIRLQSLFAVLHYIISIRTDSFDDISPLGLAVFSQLEIHLHFTWFSDFDDFLYLLNCMELTKF